MIIPTIGRDFSLKRAISSVISQEINELEIVVVNDSDYSIESELISEFGNFCELVVVKSDKRSAAGARNIGIKTATKDYITFLDDDDIFLPGRLQRFWRNRYLLDSEFSFLTTNRKYTADGGASFTVSEEATGLIHLNQVVYRNTVDISIFCKRKYLISLNGYDENLKALEDWDLVIRMLADNAGKRLNASDLLIFEHQLDRRVSTIETHEREIIANKHKSLLGPKWFSRIMSSQRYRTRNLSVIDGLSLSLEGRNIRPIYLASKLFVKKILMR